MSQGQPPGGPPPASADAHQDARRAMVEEQLVRRGISNPALLEVMRRLPRHLFVSLDLQDAAYQDRPLPLGYGQTISQPYMVARATELAAPVPGERALEVGAGCGYQAAVLGEMGARVYAIEVVPALAERAAANLRAVGQVDVLVGSFDGSAGWPEHAPYDVIVVSAGAPSLPVMLMGQLAENGRLVVPVSETTGEQVLTVVRRRGDDYDVSRDTRCRYVDLVGRYGVGWDTPRA